MIEFMPYIASVLCATIAGFFSYSVARKQAKDDLKMIVKQHEVDLEALERKHQMEIEKINLEHSHQLELKEKELGAALGTSFLTEAMRMPEVRQQISQGIRKGKR